MISSILPISPVFGTCAGAILLAREVRNPPQASLGVLDAVIERNAYGRQIDSSILFSETKLPGDKLEMVFIRAPRISKLEPESKFWPIATESLRWCDRGIDGRHISSRTYPGSARSQGISLIW